MLKRDLYLKTVLTLIAACLVILIVQGQRPSVPLGGVAHADDMGKINYAKDHGVGVACSADGKYVYVAGTEGVIRSDDYGRLGSWEKSIKED